MPVRTGKQYIDGLKSRPRDVWLRGECIRDVTSHPAFAAPMRPRAALRFGAVVGVNYLLTMALVSLSASLIDSALVGKLAALPLIALIGFGFSKHWVFR